VISLQFSTQNDAESALIRAFDHCPFSHVDAIMGEGSLCGARSDVIGGIPAGVQTRPAGYAAFSKVLRVDLPSTDGQATAFRSFVASQIGKPYDMLAIAAFAIDRAWRDTDAWFCSELQSAAIEAAGIFPHKLYSSANRITPGDLLLLCSSLTDIVQVG
jgi:hypothetical protein